jgi:hypothetical protein
MQQLLIKFRISLEPSVEIVAEAMMAIEFIDQLEHGPGTEAVHLPHQMMTTKALLGLISEIDKATFGANTRTESSPVAGCPRRGVFLFHQT